MITANSWRICSFPYKTITPLFFHYMQDFIFSFVCCLTTNHTTILHFKTIILLSSTYECFEFQPYCTLENNLLNSTLQRVNVYIPDFDRVIVYYRPWSSNKEIWDLGYVHFLAITGRKKSRIPCFKHSASTYFSRVWAQLSSDTTIALCVKLIVRHKN